MISYNWDAEEQENETEKKFLIYNGLKSFQKWMKDINVQIQVQNKSKAR